MGKRTTFASKLWLAVWPVLLRLVAVGVVGFVYLMLWMYADFMTAMIVWGGSGVAVLIGVGVYWEFQDLRDD